MRNQLLSRFSNYALYSKIKLGFMWQLALKEWGAPFYGRRAANFWRERLAVVCNNEAAGLV